MQFTGCEGCWMDVSITLQAADARALDQRDHSGALLARVAVHRVGRQQAGKLDGQSAQL